MPSEQVFANCEGDWEPAASKCQELRVQGLRVRGAGMFGVSGLGFRVEGCVGYRVEGLGLRLGCRVHGYQVHGFGFRAQNLPRVNQLTCFRR